MDPIQSVEFGTLLKQHRLDAGFSQEALAARASVSVEAISALERGVRHAPRAETIGLLAVALGLSEQEHAALKDAARRHRGPRAAAAAPSDQRHPPLASLAGLFPPAQALPVPLVDPVGRERELAALTALLRDGVRLLTLTGPGGAGKTLLTLHAANLARDRFPDGAAYVPLAALPDPTTLAAAHARLLDLREGGQPLPEDVVAPLRGKRRLLLLDNYERVATAAPLLADLCAACPDLTLLVTSRVALRVRGAQVFPVPPLALPDPAHLPAIEEFAHYPAVQLFVRRIQDVEPDFALTPATAATVAALCHALDGLPLAIELAAARARLRPLPDLLASLDQQPLDVLSGGPCDLPPRQQTMRATLDWSYDPLDTATQAVFRRLAVFPDGCTLEAAAAVGAGAAADVAAASTAQGQAGDIFARVATLVDNHLLRRDHTDSAARLTMLSLVRAYGLERLRERGEEEDARRRHALYVLSALEATA